jgi:uncharacterized surface protein with fasciclin (FAS1) repeats
MILEGENDMFTSKSKFIDKGHGYKGPVKIRTMLWLVMILAIGLTACTVTAQTPTQQKDGASPSAKPVYDIAKLPGVLLPHMLDVALTSSDLAAKSSVVTQEGTVLKVNTKNGKLILNDKVNVVEPDIIACNGVIYVIDQTINESEANTDEATATVTATATATLEPTATITATPVSCKDGLTIAAILRADPRFSDFVLALDSMGYMDMLDKDGSYTVFAPPNGVFVAPLLDTNGEKVTICHATGSTKNPFVEITIDVNGLNGHAKHSGDIIPAPAGGCPGKTK